MQFKLYRIIISVLIITCVAFGQATILHSPPREVVMDVPILIESIIEDNTSDVERVRVFYRVAGQSAYLEEEMLEYMGVFKANIPAEYVTESGVEYLIVAEFSDGSMAAFPEADPYNVPMFLSAQRRVESVGMNEIALREIQGGIPSNVIILGPEEGEIVASEEVIIAVSLFNTPDVDLKSITLELDDVSILEYTEIAEDLIVARPKNVQPGMHTIKLNMANHIGDSYSTVIWHFTVVRTVAQARRIFNYSGRVTAQTSSLQVRGIRQNIHYVRANANGSFDWLSFTAKGFLSSQEDPDRQPRNRLMAGLKTTYFDLFFGDVNPQLSEFTLRGKRVRGLEAHLKLKYFNVHFVTGESERAIPGMISSIPDTISQGLQYKRSGYTYSRKVIGIRPYFGTGRHFQFGLSLLKALDDTLSVKKEYGGISEIDNTFINMGGVNKPKDNIVLGTDFTISIDNRRFVWKSDAAFSYLNRDISDGPLTLRDLDTFAPGDSLENDTLSFGEFNIPLSDIPIDPGDISNIFIINQNLSPLLPIVPDSNGVVGLKEFLNMPSTAFKTALTLNYFNNFVVLKYQRVGPEFNSLGNPFMRSDIQGVSLSDKIRLFSNKIFITLNYDQIRDNLLENKPATTTTSSFAAGFRLYPGEGLPSINFNTRHYSRSNDITELDTSYYYDDYGNVIEDSLKLSDKREKNMTIRQNIQISHLIELGGVKNNISVTYVNSERSDGLDNRPAGFTFNSVSTSMIRFGVSSVYPFPLKTNLNISTNKNESGLSSKPIEFVTLSMRGQYDFFDAALSAIAGYQMTNASGLVDFTQNNMYIAGHFKFLKINQVRGRLSYTRINDRTGNENFNDVSFMMTYSISF